MKTFLRMFFAIVILTTLVPQKALAENFPETTALATPLPYREAQHIAGVTEKQGIWLAARTLSDKECEVYFAHTMADQGVLPVMVVISNNSRTRLLVQGSDAKLITASGEHSQTPPPEVMAKIREKITHGIGIVMDASLRRMNELAVRQAAHFLNSNNKGLNYQILAPGQSITGMVYFPAKKLGKEPLTLHLSVQDLDRVRYLDLEAGVQ